MIENIFIYGTLRPDEAPGSLREIIAQLHRLGGATVRGRLYDAGDYPAAVLDPAAGPIAGELFQSSELGRFLPVLDRYEEFQPESPNESLFRRVPCLAYLDSGRSVEAWIYVYNRSVAALSLIASGQWQRRRKKPA